MYKLAPLISSLLGRAKDTYTVATKKRDTEVSRKMQLFVRGVQHHQLRHCAGVLCQPQLSLNHLVYQYWLGLVATAMLCERIEHFNKPVADSVRMRDEIISPQLANNVSKSS